MIATGFETHNGPAQEQAPAAAPVKVSGTAPGKTGARAQATPVGEEEDSGFTDIMSIFNKY